MPSLSDVLTVRAPLQYAQTPADGEELYFYYMKELPEGVRQKTNLELEEIKSVFYPEMETLMKSVTGATRVLIFDHMLRKGSTKEDASRVVGMMMPGVAKPTQRAHVDYTLHSCPNRLKAFVSAEEAERLQKTPYAIVQAWRPLKGPVLDSPLAICDAATVRQEDLNAVRLQFADRTGYTYVASFNPTHRYVTNVLPSRWYYAKEMQTNEVFLFVGYDSRDDGRARFTPHGSFQDPTVPSDAPPRESLELRAYVFWENDKQDGKSADE